MNEAKFASPRDYMERALGSARGIRVRCLNVASARSLMNRCNSVISQERKQSKKIFQPDEPGWNSCPYENLSFHIVPDWLVPGQEPDLNVEIAWLYICPESNPNEGVLVETL